MSTEIERMTSKLFRFALCFVICAPLLAISQTTPRQGSQILLRTIDAAKAGESGGRRITNGQPATIVDNPWQVAILASQIASNDQAQYCGGAIVAKRWVLTAAHCVDEGTQPAQIEILNDTASLTAGGTRVAVDRIVVNPNWDASTHDSDIALVHVRLDLSGSALPAIDKMESGFTPGSAVRITGWGALSWEDNLGTTVLQQVEIPYVSTPVFNKPASYDHRITDNMICAGRDGNDSCGGDSGGPATCVVGGARQLVGIVSWGAENSCGLPNIFGVYTRVSQFRDWVRKASSGDVNW